MGSLKVVQCEAIQEFARKSFNQLIWPSGRPNEYSAKRPDDGGMGPVKYPHRSTRKNVRSRPGAEIAADRPAGPPPPTKTSFLAMIGISRSFQSIHSVLLDVSSSAFLSAKALTMFSQAFCYLFRHSGYLPQKGRFPDFSTSGNKAARQAALPQRISTRRSILSTCLYFIRSGKNKATCGRLSREMYGIYPEIMNGTTPRKINS